jgi:hypothetical protein
MTVIFCKTVLSLVMSTSPSGCTTCIHSAEFSCFRPLPQSARSLWPAEASAHDSSSNNNRTAFPHQRPQEVSRCLTTIRNTQSH